MGDGSGSDGAATRRQFITSDCSSDDDCAPGECRELVPGGYRVCVDPPEEAESCEPDMGGNQCCSSDDCDEGRCMRFIGGYCVANETWPHNRCASDECDEAADCDHLENGVCFPAGAYSYPVATCVAGGCRLDSDCVEEEGGRCALHWDPCCDLPKLACVYPSDGCQTDEECMPDFCRTVESCAEPDCSDLLACTLVNCTVVNGRSACEEIGAGCFD